MDFSYLVSRLRARKGEIFAKKDYEHIIVSNSLSEMKDYLRVSSYGPYIEAGSEIYEDPEQIILYALRQHVVKLFQFIWENKPRGGENIIKFLFSKWEMYNLKLILRGIHRGINPEDLKQKFIPAGEFTDRRLHDLVKLESIEAVIRYLLSAGSPYGRILENCAAEKNREILFRDMEICLDRSSLSYFSSCISNYTSDGKAMKSFIRYRIDIVNTLTLLKNLGEVFSDTQHTDLKTVVRAEQFIEGGGRFTLQKFNDFLKETSLDNLLRRLSDMLRDPGFSEILIDADPEDVVRTEERYEDLIEKYLFRRSLQDPHGFYFIGSFLYMKMREVKNLRFILSSIKYKLDIEEVNLHLFYPLIEKVKRIA